MAVGDWTQLEIGHGKHTDELGNTTLQLSGCTTSKEKQGKDGDVLPVDHANDVQVRVGQPGNNDIARPEVGMADVEIAEGRILWDQLQCNTEIMVQDLNVIQRQLLLVVVSIPPYALERQKRSTELLQISSFLLSSSEEHYLSTFIHIDQLV